LAAVDDELDRRDRLELGEAAAIDACERHLQSKASEF
jgi:hypothetical protein